MATRAIQDNLQLVGFRDPTTDVPLAGGTVEFYGAGTLVAKEAWEDKNKVTAVTSVTLNSFGQAQLYFDGVYKFIVKDSLGTTKYTLDDLKFQANATTVLTKTNDYQTTSDDDVILVDTTAGAITITLYTAASSSNSITIKNIGGSGNTAFVAPFGAELINGSASNVSLVDGAAQAYYSDLTQWFGAATTTGVAYTTANLIAGNGIDFTAGGGQTVVSVDLTDGTIAATTTQKGIVERATDAEVTTATDIERYVTPAQASLMTVLSAATAGGVTSATQTEQEAAVSITAAVTPSVQQFHPSACKAWGDITDIAGINASYGITSASVTAGGPPDTYTVNWSVDFSSVDYGVLITDEGDINSINSIFITAKSVGSISFKINNFAVGLFTGGTKYNFTISAFGDQV